MALAPFKCFCFQISDFNLVCSKHKLSRFLNVNGVTANNYSNQPTYSQLFDIEYRLNLVLERQERSLSQRYSAWTRPATTRRRSSFHRRANSPCRSPSWSTPSASTSRPRCTHVLVARSCVRTSVSSSRASTLSWAHQAASMT